MDEIKLQKTLLVFLQALELLEKKIAQESIECMCNSMKELSLHRRDQHQGYYDVESLFEGNQKREKERMKTHEKFSKVISSIHSFLNFP